MPTYEYRCAKCGDELEVFQTFAEKALTKHVSCGGRLARVFSPAGIVLKGSGFYKTDNRDAPKRSGSKDSDNGSSDSTTKSNETNGSGSGSSDSTTESKESSGGSESGKSGSGKSGSGDSGSGKSDSSRSGSNGSDSKPKKMPEAKTA